MAPLSGHDMVCKKPVNRLGQAAYPGGPVGPSFIATITVGAVSVAAGVEVSSTSFHHRGIPHDSEGNRKEPIIGDVLKWLLGDEVG